MNIDVLLSWVGSTSPILTREAPAGLLVYHSLACGFSPMLVKGGGPRDACAWGSGGRPAAGSEGGLGHDGPMRQTATGFCEVAPISDLSTCEVFVPRGRTSRGARELPSRYREVLPSISRIAGP